MPGFADVDAQNVAPGHVVLHFRMIVDPFGLLDFRAATNDLEVIGLARRQMDLPEHERTLHIDGPIARGGGGHNLEWSWHFVPGQWNLTDASSELCNGNPFIVEQAVQYWVDEVGRFCPSGAYVVEQIGTLSESTDGLIVKYVTSLSSGELEAAIERAQGVAGELGMTLTYFRSAALDSHVFRLERQYSIEEVAELAVALAAADSTVEYAEPDRMVKAY